VWLSTVYLSLIHKARSCVFRMIRKKQSVLLSNGKYIPVNTRGVNPERVLDSIVNETGLRMIEFSVSKFMPGFMEVTSATLL